MVFNNLFFIFCFLPISLILYALFNKNLIQNIVLVIVSLLFYSWASPVTLILLLLSITFNYVSALSFTRAEDEKIKKISFWVAIVVNVLVLAIYKYLPINISPSLVPVGLSFFTFSSISYLADVYMGVCEAQKDWLKLALYVSFFPKISMGPIAYYRDFEEQLSKRSISGSLTSQGMILFIRGLVKKVVLADQFALLFANLADNTSILGTWIYAIAYMLQIYFDFSGYSDMAIGLSNMFGFTIKKNFNYPYIAKSVQDFWRRWHISLSLWFRNYIYIPLGGNRVSTAKYVRNIFVVWMLTGIWHGNNWTFIVWGLYYALFLLLEKFVLKDVLQKFLWVGHIYTLLVVLVGWVFFFSPDILSAFATLGRMVGIGVSGFGDSNAYFEIFSHLLLLIMGMICSTNVVSKIEVLVYNKAKNTSILVMSAVYIVLFVVCIAYMVGSTFQTFLYSAF